MPQQQAFASSLQQVMAQSTQPIAPNPPNQADLIATMISNIQRSSQQPSTTSQQPALNNQLNMNHLLQSFQQRQQPNPTMNLLDNALRNLTGSQTPPAQPMSNPPISSQQMNAIQILASLCGMPSSAGAPPNTSTTPVAFEDKIMSVTLLILMLMNRLSEEDRQRRIQVDALQNAIIANIGQILGQGSGGGNSRHSAVQKSNWHDRKCTPKYYFSDHSARYTTAVYWSTYSTGPCGSAVASRSTCGKGGARRRWRSPGRS